MVWTSTVNDPAVLLSGFAGELQKDTASKGGFKADYEALCSANNIEACPFVVSTSDAACRVSNCIIDLPSWRAALLAMSTINSTVVELSLHGCSISPQHLLDLAATMEKMGTLQVLKLDYCIIREMPDGGTPAVLLKPFIWGGTAAPVEYLSLKGNSLGDDFCLDPSIYQSLSGNFALQALSLADNGITDAGACEVLKAARLAASLKELSFANNPITFTSEFSSCLSGLFAGTTASADDETAWKNAAKVIADRNKAVKDTNKKRKKAGYSELPDTPTPAERISKGPDGANVIANRTISSIDISLCPLRPESDSLFAECLSVIRGAPKAAGPALSLRLMLRGNFKDAGAESVDVDAEGVTIVA